MPTIKQKVRALNAALDAISNNDAMQPERKSKFIGGSNFRPSQDLHNVCANCRTPFDSHYNGQCPRQ